MIEDLTQRRVLIVDDVKANVDVLVAALRGHHKLSVALGGPQALELVGRAPPDLVLLDVMMPDVDGYEVCRRLRADPATRELPVIFLTALDDTQSKVRGFEAGGTDYVTKPFDVVEVRARVRSLLRAKAWQDHLRELQAAELRVAREIQLGMVPADVAEALGGPQALGGGDAAAALVPAKEVGGDLYVALPRADGRALVALGDVSGKGVPAALFMAVAVTLLRTLGREVAGPGALLARINDELARDNPSCTFVTLLAAVVDLPAGRVTFANGGHCAPAVVPPGGAARLLEEHGGTALGLAEGLEFVEQEVALAPGEALVLYSDGVTEAFDPGQALFGDDRLRAALSGRPAGPAGDLVEALLAAVRAHAAGAPQSDDIAVLALRRAPAPAGAPPDARLELAATPEEVMRGCEAADAFARSAGAPDEAARDLKLALEELLTNVVVHAYGRDAARRLTLALRALPGGVAAELRDGGPPWDPRQAPAPDLELDPDERAIGGLGVHLVLSLVDALDWRREGDENVVTVTKRWGA